MARGAGTLVLTLPFLFPYHEAQRVFGFERPFGEVVLVLRQRLVVHHRVGEPVAVGQGACATTRTAKGETFLGFVPWLLAAVALVGLIWQRKASTDAEASGEPCACVAHRQ